MGGSAEPRAAMAAWPEGAALRRADLQREGASLGRYALGKLIAESREVTQVLPLHSSSSDEYRTAPRPPWQENYAADVDWDWRPEGDRPEGLFEVEHEHVWLGMLEWVAKANTLMEERGRGLPSARFPDFFAPASVLRPEARAIGPWLTGRTLVKAITPVAVVFPGGLTDAKVNTSFWTGRSKTDMDQSICLEMGEGIMSIPTGQRSLSVTV